MREPGTQLRVEARSGSAEFPREGEGEGRGGCWFHKHARSLARWVAVHFGRKGAGRGRGRGSGEGEEGEGEGVDVREYEGGGGWGLWEGRDLKESEGCGLKA